MYEKNTLSEKKSKCTVSTTKRLASLFLYLIVSTIIMTINGYEIACIWNAKYNVHVCMIETNADFMFQKLLFLFLVDFILRKQLNNYCRLQCSRINICPSCFVYDLSNRIFCPIGSAQTKHPVGSQIWTHNSKRLAHTLTAQKVNRN